MPINIHQRTKGGVEILTLAGRLTLGEGSSALREAVRAAIERRQNVLVDLSQVTYIDSAGLGEMVASYASVAAAGQAMKLLRPNKRVDSMLQITKLYTTFEVYEDEIAALGSFAE